VFGFLSRLSAILGCSLYPSRFATFTTRPLPHRRVAHEPLFFPHVIITGILLRSIPLYVQAIRRKSRHAAGMDSVW